MGELLQVGQRSSTYRAVRNADGQRITLKVLDPGRGSAEDAARLENEYEIGRVLEGAAVVRPLALSSFEGRRALELEDVPFASLERLVGRPMPVDDFLRLASRLAAVVAEVHERGVIHKDLKPGNILFCAETGEVKVCDFGIASRLRREQATSRPARLIEGSLPYVSPEQTGRMNRGIDSRSDLYSLGVTFYQLLTGRLPFEASDPLEWVYCHVARRAPPVKDLAPDTPAVVSDIVAKLLAKMADDRYQTALGLQHDLERCLAERRAGGELARFPLGERDVSGRFEIAQRLYGRDDEVGELLSAFDRVVERGTPELVLVSGYSGIGKSSLVRELHRPIVRERGLFLSGKLDQYRRELPYSTFAQAFAELIEQILGESEEQLASWRERLQQALGSNAQLIIEIIPQIELVMGPQPAVAELPPLEAQNRFHMVFRQFLGVFARKEQPLALFLDDLQWLDSGSLKLIEDLLRHPQTRHLLLLGAYRDNEVGPSHPLTLTLENIRKAGVIVREIVLAPLSEAHLCQFIADTLRCAPAHAEPLARLVHEKTAGNPFFAIQFLTTLYDEGLLELDRGSTWRWDAEKIVARGFTDNVIDLMVRKIMRLPSATREAMKLAACSGNVTDLRTLAVISDAPPEQVERDLREAVREGLLLKQGEAYAFLHDRVQQGAYVLIEEEKKREVHLKIGRLLLANLDARSLEERLFEVVSQLNHGADLITSQKERDSLARLNLAAARRAKRAIAYAPARGLLLAAAALLPEDAWASRYALTFEVFKERAECEYLCGSFEQAEVLFELLLGHARSSFDAARVYELWLKLYQVAGKYDEAVAIALRALRLFGVEIPEDDRALREATRAEAEAVKVNLRGRTIAELADAPEATDPSVRAVIGLLSNAAPAAYIGSRPQVFPLIILKQVNHSLRYGHTYESCMGYSAYGLMLVSLYDDPRAAFEFSEMSIRLNQKIGDISRRGTVLHLHGDHVNFWSNHIATDFPILERGFLACLDAGDLVYAGFIAFEIVWQAVERGDALDDVLAMSGKYAAFASDSRNEAVYQTILMERQFIACLKGRTRDRATFDDDSFDEAASLAAITAATFGCGVVFYHMMKLIAAYLFGDDERARHHAEEAKKTLSAAMAMPMEATFHCFHALVLARAYPLAAEGERPAMLAALEEHRRKLGFWAEHCPENFAGKHALVAAEIARVAGDELEAERRYEEAIRSSRGSGFVHWEGLAHELASAFFRDRGLGTAADAYLRAARGCYARWGADAKVRELDARHPQLREAPSPGPGATFAVRSEQLDLLSVVKASQTISGVMVREQLLRTLLQLVLEQGGARRARLILIREGGHEGELEISTESGVSEPAAGGEPGGPESVLQFAQRTRERVLLDDAAADAGSFSGDPYFKKSVRPRSVLCLPILRQTAVVGLLYLENDLLPGAFTPERLLALELLASQAAISLENSLLLERERAARELAEAERRRALLLGEATATMSSKPDFEGISSALTGLCSRSFADWAVIDVMEGGQATRLVGAHRDPDKAPLLRELAERYPARSGTPTPVVTVLNRGEPILISNISDEQIRSYCVDDHHAELIRRLGARCFLVVPLLARGAHLGALTLASAEPERFEPADVELAMELSRRAAVAIDNARLLALESSLRQSQKMEAIGRLAGGVAHDFNNLLTVILTYAQLLARGLREGDPARGQLEQIILAGEGATELTRQLLAFSRQQVLERRLVDLNKVVSGLEKLLVRLLGADIELVFLPAPSLGKTLADPTQIEQILLNLVVNARDAMPRGGKLTIETRSIELDEEYAGQHVGVAPGRYVKLTVTDTGEGMDRETQARIFEPFFTTKEKGKGTGLGLATVFGITQQSGGHIDVASELGKGTSFRVYLPSRSESGGSAPPPPMPSSTRGSETILLVEDDTKVRVAARTILQGSGYVVLEAPGPGEALLICEQHQAKIHLLLTDVVMPRMSGRELAERVSAARPGIRTLFMSGYAGDATAERGGLGANAAFLQKPLTPDSLTRKVREVLDDGALEEHDPM